MSARKKTEPSEPKFTREEAIDIFILMSPIIGIRGLNPELAECTIQLWEKIQSRKNNMTVPDAKGVIDSVREEFEIKTKLAQKKAQKPQ